MSTTSFTDRKPALPLSLGLVALILGIAVLTMLQVLGNPTLQPAGLPLSTTSLAIIAAIFGTIGSLLTVLLYAAIVWGIGKLTQAQHNGFVRAAAVVAVGLGIAAVLQVLVTGVEFMLTGRTQTIPVTSAGRLFGPQLAGVDFVQIVGLVITFWGMWRYLGFKMGVAIALVLLSLLINVGLSAFASTLTPTV